MSEFQDARQAMLDGQLRATGVKDQRLLAAMGSVPREQFLPVARRSVAYIDAMQPLAELGALGRFLPPPSVFARLVQLADITQTDRVLYIGVGSGYPAAVLAEVAATVHGLEAHDALADLATVHMTNLGLENVQIIHGGVDALADETYDAIILEGAIDQEPDHLLPLLNSGGRLVALLRRRAVGVATVYTNTAAGVTARSEFNASLPALHGPVAADEFVF